MTNEVSTSLSLTRPASAALASPAPMLAATSATVTGASNFFWLPSGSVMTGIGKKSKSDQAVEGRASCQTRSAESIPTGRGGLADIGICRPALLLARMATKRPSKSAPPLRFAVVGLGHIAQAAVLPAFRHARPHVELAALVSGTKAKLKTLGRRYSVKHLASYADAASCSTAAPSTRCTSRRPTPNTPRG